MDEGKLGQIQPTPEFPSLKPEDMEEIRILFFKLQDKFLPIDPLPDSPLGFDAYTGTGVGIGEGNIVYNSDATFDQFIYALAMTRKDLVRRIAQDEPDNLTRNIAEVLIKDKVMAGMKILDLGCSSTPVLARCCRALGADVWTVDLIPADFFHYSTGSLAEQHKSLESLRHIHVDLRDTNAIATIQEKSGGQFNLVTKANLIADKEFLGAKDIAIPLLKKGGVYFGSSNNIELKH